MAKLILVDDDIDIIDTLSQLLEIDGYEVLAKGNNGKEAFELYKQFKPNVTILDMKMPEYDGQYAIDQIKKVDPDAKIIILSGYVNDDFKETECLRFISKPCNLEKLKSLIGELMNKQPACDDVLILNK